MPKFNKKHIKELKSYLYESDDHDAEIEVWEYDSENRVLRIKAVNPITKTDIDIIFIDVQFFCFIRDSSLKGEKTLNAIITKEEYSDLPINMKLAEDRFRDSLYLVCELFSRDILHVISKELIFENRRHSGTE